MNPPPPAQHVQPEALPARYEVLIAIALYLSTKV